MRTLPTRVSLCADAREEKQWIVSIQRRMLVNVMPININHSLYCIISTYTQFLKNVEYLSIRMIVYKFRSEFPYCLFSILISVKYFRIEIIYENKRVTRNSSWNWIQKKKKHFCFNLKLISESDRKIFRVAALCQSQLSELRWHNNLRRAKIYHRAWVIARYADSQSSQDYQIANALRSSERSIESFKLLLYIPCSLPFITHVSPIVFSIYRMLQRRSKYHRYDISTITKT